MNSEPLDQTRKSLAHWQDVWDQACEEGLFEDDTPKQSAEPVSIDPATSYIAGIETEPELMQEDKTPNPVWPDSVGKDQENPEPVWVKEEIVKEIEGLKNKLFELENKFAKDSGDFIDQASGDKKVMSQIESLRKEIDKMSSSLGIENEPSPWVTEDE